MPQVHIPRFGPRLTPQVDCQADSVADFDLMRASFRHRCPRTSGWPWRGTAPNLDLGQCCAYESTRRGTTGLPFASYTLPALLSNVTEGSAWKAQ
jgi:hypothetical protein